VCVPTRCLFYNPILKTHEQVQKLTNVVAKDGQVTLIYEYVSYPSCSCVKAKSLHSNGAGFAGIATGDFKATHPSRIRE